MDINGIFGEAFWYVAPLLVTLTTMLTGAINRRFQIKGSVKQAVSWLVGSVFSFCAWALGFISFGAPTWLGLVCLCVVVGLSSNGFYDIPVIKAFINTWFKKFNHAKDLQD